MLLRTERRREAMLCYDRITEPPLEAATPRYCVFELGSQAVSTKDLFMKLNDQLLLVSLRTLQLLLLLLLLQLLVNRRCNRRFNRCSRHY